MTILGIDPGFGRLGWAVVESKGQDLKLIEYGCFETKSGQKIERRLLAVGEEVGRLVGKYKPDAAGVEDIFYFKNAKTVINVAQSRGVVIAELARNDILTKSFTPLQIKSSVSGHGRADKSQVQNMVKRLLKLESVPKPDDAADACAVAIALAFS
ncbi:crossover junction endodeoxyribonuclease RuvC [Patescibacteria group bacterium]